MQTKQEIIDAWYDEKKQIIFAECQKMFEEENPNAEKVYKEKMAWLKKKYQDRSFAEIERERSMIGKEPILPKIEKGWEKVIRLFNER